MYKLLTELPKSGKLFLDYNEEMKYVIMTDIKNSVKHLSQMRKNDHVFFCDLKSSFLVYHNEKTGKVWTARIDFRDEDRHLIEPEPNEILLIHEVHGTIGKDFLYKIVEKEAEKIQHSFGKNSQ